MVPLARFASVHTNCRFSILCSPPPLSGTMWSTLTVCGVSRRPVKAHCRLPSRHPPRSIAASTAVVVTLLRCVSSRPPVTSACRAFRFLPPLMLTELVSCESRERQLVRFSRRLPPRLWRVGFARPTCVFLAEVFCCVVDSGLCNSPPWTTCVATFPPPFHKPGQTTPRCLVPIHIANTPFCVQLCIRLGAAQQKRHAATGQLVAD